MVIRKLTTIFSVSVTRFIFFSIKKQCFCFVWFFFETWIFILFFSHSFSFINCCHNISGFGFWLDLLPCCGCALEWTMKGVCVSRLIVFINYHASDIGSWMLRLAAFADLPSVTMWWISLSPLLYPVSSVRKRHTHTNRHTHTHTQTIKWDSRSDIDLTWNGANQSDWMPQLDRWDSINTFAVSFSFQLSSCFRWFFLLLQLPELWRKYDDYSRNALRVFRWQVLTNKQTGKQIVSAIRHRILTKIEVNQIMQISSSFDWNEFIKISFPILIFNSGPLKFRMRY